MSKKTYTVLSAIEHDQVRYEKDSSIDLSDAQAELLYAAGAISGPTGDAAGEPPTDAAKRKTAITIAIAQLDPNNGDLWLRDGKPDTLAIAAITGWSLSAAERNEAWTALNG